MEGPSPLRQLQSEEGGDNQLREEEGRKQEESFALKIKWHDEIKMLLRKLSILKDGIFAERSKKRDLNSELVKVNHKIVTIGDENKRKQRKHEDLTAQIKKLKDELIQERNSKHKISEDLVKKEQGFKNQSERKNTLGLGLFGFKSMFEAPK